MGGPVSLQWRLNPSSYLIWKWINYSESQGFLLMCHQWLWSQEIRLPFFQTLFINRNFRSGVTFRWRRKLNPSLIHLERPPCFRWPNSSFTVRWFLDRLTRWRSRLTILRMPTSPTTLSKSAIINHKFLQESIRFYKNQFVSTRNNIRLSFTSFLNPC